MVNIYPWKKGGKKKRTESEEEKLRMKALRSLVSKSLKDTDSPKKKRKLGKDDNSIDPSAVLKQ